MEQFWQIFLGCLGTLLAALTTWLSTRIVAWLNSKIKDKEFARYSSELTELVFNVVNQVTQTYVAGLKEKDAFTAEKQKEALQKALDTLIASISNDLKEWIEKNFGNIEAYLTTLIESAILTNKK